MTEYRERPTGVGGSTSNGTSPGRGKIRLRLALENDSEGLILDLNDVYYLPNSPCNLVSLARLNDSDIYHNNENEMLYHLKTRRVLAQAKRWKNSYLLKPLNLSDAAVQLLRTDDDTYQGPMVCQTSITNAKLPLTTWHKRLGHLSFPSLQKHLQTLEIPFLEDARSFVCDSCQRAKATKIYNRTPQKRSEHPYQFIHTDLVGPISPTGFSGER